LSARTLLKGGCVLTLGARTPNFPAADVLIEHGRVAEVGPGLRARGAEVIDATDTIVMPGFVDTHRHAWRSLFRNVGEGPGGLAVAPAVYGPHYGPDDIYAGTLAGLLGAVESGITSVVDWSDTRLGGEFTGAALQAHADAGLRTVFVHSTPLWADAGRDGTPASTALVPGRSSLPADATVAFGSPHPTGADLDRIVADWTHARAAGLRIHAHVGMDADAPGIVAGLGERGVLAADVTLVHCSHLAPADLDAVATHRVAVSISPASEMAGGLGPPPIQALIDRGIRPGLGVDDVRVAPGDMFAQMRATNSIQHATMFDLKLAGKAGLPTLLSTREVIRYATIDGANVAGLGDLAGSIEVGKQADIIVLRADRPNIAPVNDPIGAVVWGMDTSNVDWVFVGGKALMAGGALAADVGRARALAVEAQRRVADAAGLGVGARP
jgi:cytosine/adenosine deaminase-related metal-dependent hydrolase